MCINIYYKYMWPRPNLMGLRMMSGEHEDCVAMEMSPSLVRCRINPKQLYMYIYRSIYSERYTG